MDKSSHHPVLKSMLELGCKDQSNVAVAFQVYMQLREISALWDVNYKYNEELDVIYFTGRKSKSAPLEVFVPVNAKCGLSPKSMHTLQDKLCDGTEIKSITLAVKEQDSTVVFYNLTPGLLRPESHEETQRKKRLSEQRSNLQSELRKNRDAIFMRTQDTNMSSQVKTDDNPECMEHDECSKQESDFENESESDDFSEEL